MNLGDNFRDSFEYAKKLFSDAVRLIILIVLSIIPIVEWIVLGYMARVLKEAPGQGTPPKLENYGRLFVDGAKVFFATLLYMLIPIILIAIGAVGTFTNLVPALLIGGAGRHSFVVILLVGIVIAIPLLIILAAGLAHMVKTGKFGNVFAFGEIFRIIHGIGWGKYLSWIVITFVGGAVLFGILSIIPVIGRLLAAIVQPIYYVFIFRSLGLLYNDGAPAGVKVQAPAVSGLACATCGTSIQPQHKFCPNCGAAAPTPPPISSPQAQPLTEKVTSFPKPSSEPIVPTGYGELDRMLAGGIPEGYAVVFVSPSYDETDLLIRKIIESSLASGRSTFYLSNDIARTRDLTTRFDGNFWAMSPVADKIASDRANLLKVPDVGVLSELNISLNQIIEGKSSLVKEKLIVIDLLSDVLLRNKALTTRRWLSDFVGRRKAADFTTVATLDPLIATKEDVQTIIGLFDGVIEVFEKELQERARRFLVIKKMYGRQYSDNELMLDRQQLL